MSDLIGSLKRFVDEFRRWRTFRVAAVYLVVGWVLIQLASATFVPLGLPLWFNRLLIILLALGFVLACVLALVYDLGARAIERAAATALPP
ncbi:MAG TPA: hypothetical protein VIQ48_12130, partial [Rhodanobacter sp.]